VIGVRSGPLAPRIWLLDPASGETVPLFEDDQILGSGPRWSPVGQRLAFYSHGDAAVLVYDFDTGESVSFDTLSGVGSWGPDGRQMVIPDTVYRGEREVSYVARVDLDGSQAFDLSKPEAAGGSNNFWQDASPVWSLTGEWIAVGRFGLADGTWTWGQQLWVIRPDGSQARPLVTDAEANLGAFAWCPDGGALVYVRVIRENLANPSPGLWFISLQEEQPLLLATNAVLPGWLP
jgi:Tol biopolymer transport system component